MTTVEETALRERIARDIEEACAASYDHGVACGWCVHATRIVRGASS